MIVYFPHQEEVVAASFILDDRQQQTTCFPLLVELAWKIIGACGEGDAIERCAAT